MKKALKRTLDWFVFLLTGKGDIAIAGALHDLVDLSGQGRNKYGK